MNEQGSPSIGQSQPPLGSAPARLLRWTGRFFYYACLVGLGAFGIYIILRGTGSTFKNFDQWHDLIAGLPMRSVSNWISNLGIGMHFVCGAVLVLAWPILLSSHIRAHHRAVHRWTGRAYVTAGLLAGTGGLSFIFTRGAYTQSASIAFGIWGAVMMLSAAMAYFHARAKRFDLHRAWAIRLFAMVLGSWLFDLEIRAWKDLAGGVGFGEGSASGPLDYAMLYLFFVPNLLVAEFFIRNKHRWLVEPGNTKWPTVAALAIAGLIFGYAIVAVTATHTGKYGKHLLQLVSG